MGDKLKSYRYKVAKIFRTHEAFIVLILVLLVLTAVLVRINTLSNLPADEAYYQKQTEGITTVNFNQDAIKEIESLRDSNVAQPGTALPDNRSNPFTE